MEAGDLISGKYRLMRLLGQGGMGSVWAARNELTDRDFAIKFLHPKLADNKEALHRFFLEARACGQIKHPAVVDVYDMGQAEDGSPYLVMQMLEGEGYDQRLMRAGVFRPSEAATWVAFVARGLEEAHVRGLVHRDLKPGNIFFALDDRGDVIPKVLDFGVSKASHGSDGALLRVTDTGAVLGSPAYMSPEQARGDADIDGRSDVWALGVILYESLTGKMPFDAPNYNALMVAIISAPHRPIAEVAPGVPGELSQIVDHALAKDRGARISTARELAEKLEFVATRITESSPAIYGSRTPSLMGVPIPSIAGATSSPFGTPTTHSSWAEDANPGKRRPNTATVTAALGAATLALALGFAYLRSRPPLVAIAGRSSVALATSLARLSSNLGSSAVLGRPVIADSGAPQTVPASSSTGTPATSTTAAVSAAPTSAPRTTTSPTPKAPPPAPPPPPPPSGKKGVGTPVQGPGF